MRLSPHAQVWNSDKQFEKVGFTEAKKWMEIRLAKFKSGIPRQTAVVLASNWYDELEDRSSIDHKIIEIEAAKIKKEYDRWHVPTLGDMQKKRPDGVFRFGFGNLNNASTLDSRRRKVARMEYFIDTWDVQGGGVSEVGVNGLKVPASQSFDTWFKDSLNIKATATHNTNPGEDISTYQPGGIALFACKELAQYCKKSTPDFRGLGRWHSWRVYNDEGHALRFVCAYSTGTHQPRGTSTVYQQTIRHIQDHDLQTTPRKLLQRDLVRQLKLWRQQGDRIILGMDMNEHVLTGSLAKELMGPGLEFKEATHVHWGPNEPHTFIDGKLPIDGLYYSQDLEVVATKQLSFHEGFGDHRVNLIDISTLSAIGNHEFKVVRAKARKLTSRNRKSVRGYTPLLTDHILTHRLPQRLATVKALAPCYPIEEKYQIELDTIDVQLTEGQVYAEKHCRIIYDGHQPFSEPVQVWVERRRAYQGLCRRLQGQKVNGSNIIRQAWQADIPNPKSLTYKQCQDGVKLCNDRIRAMDGVGLRKDHLRDCLVEALENDDAARVSGVKNTISQEQDKKMWRWIGRVTNDPKLGATRKVQRLENGEVVDITTKEEMEKEIQKVTEQRFLLAHSAPITNTAFAKKLGYLSDPELADKLFAHPESIPEEVSPVDRLVLEEIARLGMEIRSSTGKKFVITPVQFRFYWRKVSEQTSSSISTIHFGHYKVAAMDDFLTQFLSEKLTVVAQTGCPPSRWGNGLQVMLEKIAGVALVNKLRAILLMEADYNFFNKWAFGVEALNLLYERGYVPDEQYSQKQSTAEDAMMDTRLTNDISRQLKHPLAMSSIDAANCYDRINHIIMSLLLYAVTGWLGCVICLLSPIQGMKFFQRTALGDSTTHMGGRRLDIIFQGLCQGNGAAPACWLMLSSLLMKVYERQGRGAKMVSSISKDLIEFLGTMFVDDTNLFTWLPNLTDSKKCFFDMQESVLLWGTLLCSTGGAFKPEKCYWYLVDYECEEGVWDYKALEKAEMLIPMPDGSYEPITQLNVDVPKEMLGIWGSPSGGDSKHIEEKVLKRVDTWSQRTKNGHLPSKYAWVSYRFKLWPGVRYGLSTLAIKYEDAKEVLRTSEYKMLSMLGVNRNVKREWRTLPRAVGGIGMFSFVIEMLICQINMIIQHWGVPSVLGKKFFASAEALQVEIGCAGNPLEENYNVWGDVATDCWLKSFWQTLQHYNFKIFLYYPTILESQRSGDKLLSAVFVEQEYTDERLLSLNRCRLSHQLLFLSDMTTADGRYIEPRFLLPPSSSAPSTSKYTFPRSVPTEVDWLVWLEFWTSYTETGRALPSSLGAWLIPSHRPWQWYYYKDEEILERVNGTTISYFHKLPSTGRTRSGNDVYQLLREEDSALPQGIPASTTAISPVKVQLKCTGPQLATSSSDSKTFWEYLFSLGGTWMWEYIKPSEMKDIEWLAEALRNGTAVMVTDGSFDRQKAPDVSGAGWLIVCKKTQRRIRGSFYERSASASAYRGELLGLVALHTLCWAIVQFYKLDRALGKVCCDNISALAKSSYSPKRIRTGSAQADLLRALRTLKSQSQLQFSYEHVDSHQDDIKAWHLLSAVEQMNVRCDALAKGAVYRSMLGPTPEDRGYQLLPLEQAAVFVNNAKLTSDAAQEVRFALGIEEARQFFTAPIKINSRGVNEGGLGWTNQRFNQVDWRASDAALASKPDMYQVWLSKQVIGIAATRRNMARIQDLLDDKCPTCLQNKETTSHLNRCPDQGRTMLFNQSVDALESWLQAGNKTDPELAYWIVKYVRFRGQRTFSSLGPMSNHMRRVAASQDMIGWEDFLHGRVSVEMDVIQQLHCVASPCNMNGRDWMKLLSAKLIHISHSQWIYRNYILHEKTRGYLRLQERRKLLHDIERLVECNPDKVPEESRYLLEVDVDSLLRSSFDKQSYWVLAVKAAKRAGRRVVTSAYGIGRTRRLQRKIRKPRMRIDISRYEEEMRRETLVDPPLSRRRPHPSSFDLLESSASKRWRPPEE